MRVILVESDRGTVCDKMMAVWIFGATLKDVSFWGRIHKVIDIEIFIFFENDYFDSLAMISFFFFLNKFVGKNVNCSSIFLSCCYWGKVLSIGYIARSGKKWQKIMKRACIVLSQNVSFLETSGVWVGNLNIDEERDFSLSVHVLQVGMIINQFRFVIKGTFLHYK